VVNAANGDPEKKFVVDRSIVSFVVLGPTFEVLKQVCYCFSFILEEERFIWVLATRSTCY
jgi:hypothetical protein